MRKVLSTDIPDVAQMGLDLGFEIIDRPERLYDDDIGTPTVIRHIIEEVEKTGWKPDVVIESYICCPVRPERCFQRLLDALHEDENAGSAFFACPVSQHPTHMFQIRPDGRSTFPFGLPADCRQKDEPFYVISSAAFAMRRNIFMMDGDIRTTYYDKPIICDSKEVGDINTLEDLERATLLLRKDVG